MDYKTVSKKMEKILDNLLQTSIVENKILQDCDDLYKKIDNLRLNDGRLIDFEPQTLNELKVIINKSKILYKKVLDYLDRKYVIKLKDNEKDALNKVELLNSKLKSQLSEFDAKNITKNLLLGNLEKRLLNYLDIISNISEKFYFLIAVPLKFYKMIIENNSNNRRMDLSKVNYIKKSIKSNGSIYVSKQDIEDAFNISILNKEEIAVVNEFLLGNHRQYKNYQEEKVKKATMLQEKENVAYTSDEPIISRNIISYKSQKLHETLNNLIKLMELNRLDAIAEALNHLSKMNIEQILILIDREINEYSDLKELSINIQELRELEKRIRVLSDLNNFIYNFVNRSIKNDMPENEKIIFALNKQGVPYIIRDLKDLIDDNQKINSLKSCIETLKSETHNPTKRKKIGNNQKIEVYEIKDFQSRLIYKYLPNGYIFVTQFLIKKDNNDVFTREKIAMRNEKIQEEYDSLNSYLKEQSNLEPQIIEYHQNLLKGIIGIEDKNSLQVLKKIV